MEKHSDSEGRKLEFICKGDNKSFSKLTPPWNRYTVVLESWSDEGLFKVYQLHKIVKIWGWEGERSKVKCCKVQTSLMNFQFGERAGHGDIWEGPCVNAPNIGRCQSIRSAFSLWEQSVPDKIVDVQPDCFFTTLSTTLFGRF